MSILLCSDFDKMFLSRRQYNLSIETLPALIVPANDIDYMYCRLLELFS